MFTYMNVRSFLPIIYALLSTDTMDYLQLGSENIARSLHGIGQKSVAAHYQPHMEFLTSGAICRFHQPKFKPTVFGAWGPEEQLKL